MSGGGKDFKVGGFILIYVIYNTYEYIYVNTVKKPPEAD